MRMRVCLEKKRKKCEKRELCLRYVIEQNVGSDINY